MNKLELVCQVYYWRNFLRNLRGLPSSFSPYLERFTMKQLFYFRDCICNKIIKIQRNGV